MRTTSQRRLASSSCAALAAIVLSSPFATASAQAVRLEDVITAALKGSVQTQREEERIKRAAGQLQQAQGAFDFRTTAESGWERLYLPKQSNGTLTNELDTPNIFRTTIGIGKRFRNGIDVVPGVSWAFADSSSAVQSFGLTTPRPSLNINIPLFKGWGEEGEFASGERAAQASLEGSNLNRSFAGNRVVYQAVQVFWRCLATRQALEVLESDQRGAEDYLAALRELVAQGRMEATQFDRVNAGQASQRVALSRAQANDQLCRRDLAVVLGASSSGTLPTAIGDFPSMDGLGQRAAMLNEQALITAALTQRQDLLALARFEAAESERVRGAKNSALPQVDLVIDPTRVLIRYSQALGSNSAKGSLEAAVASEGEARLNQVLLQNQIRDDITDQVRNIRESLSNWTVLSESEGLLGTVVTDSQTSLRAGAITQQQYRDAQNELTAIKRQVIDADRKSTRLNSSHVSESRMPSSA